MYTLEDVIRYLKEDQTAICVYGELKDFEIYYHDGSLYVDEPDGAGDVLIPDEDYLTRFGDTEWVIK